MPRHMRKNGRSGRTEGNRCQLAVEELECRLLLSVDATVDDSGILNVQTSQGSSVTITCSPTQPKNVKINGNDPTDRNTGAPRPFLCARISKINVTGDSFDQDVDLSAVALPDFSMLSAGPPQPVTIRGGPVGTPGDLNPPSGKDTLVGSQFPDIIFGYDGDDVLRGEGGGDVLWGGADQDVLNGGDGNDTLQCGSGNDLALGGIGNDQLLGGDTNPDGITGADDTLKGEDGDDLIWGGPGDDWIEGGGNADVLHGDDGNDTIYGGDGSDVIWGEMGADKLYGEDGHDWMTGGTAGGGIDGSVDTIRGGLGYDTCWAGWMEDDVDFPGPPGNTEVWDH